MKHTLTAILIASSVIAMSSAQAQTAASSSASATASAPAHAASATKTKKAVRKKTAKRKVAKKPAAPIVNNEEIKEPDVTGTTVVEYQCELGNKVTVFINSGDDKHIALKWGKRIHRMSRVDTTTGANRFENHYYGLVWLDIPTKGILLDSKKGHQLANECKDAAELAPKSTDTPAPARSAQG